MSNWTLTPDGLKTDDQLWADDFLLKYPSCKCGGILLTVKAPRPCTRDIGVLFPIICEEPAVIHCLSCNNAWCRDCSGGDDE